MSIHADNLWDLVFGRPQIDPAELANAIRLICGSADLDYRTRLLAPGASGARGAQLVHSIW